MPYADPAMAKAAAKRRYEADKDAFKARAKAWIQAHPERRKEIVKKSDSSVRGMQRSRASTAAYAARHPERVAANQAASRKVNADARRRRNAERRALLAGVSVEYVEPLVVLERADGVCGICGDDVDPFGFHVDHIIALARGGEHSYANTQPAHPRCNLAKGARE